MLWFLITIPVIVFDVFWFIAYPYEMKNLIKLTDTFGIILYLYWLIFGICPIILGMLDICA